MKLPECESLLVPVTLYAHRELPQLESEAIEAHLSQCAPCKDYVRSIREFDNEFQQILTKDKLRFVVPEGPCPEPSMIVALHADQLSGELAQEVSDHLVYCKDCRSDYRLLEQLSVAGVQSADESPQPSAVAPADATKRGPEEAEELAVKPSWRDRMARAARTILELGKTYSPETLIGAIRILAAGPALAVRGAPPPAEPSMVIEVPVGDNVYGIALSWQQDGLFFDVAGYKTTELVQAGIVLSSTGGEEIVSVETDTHGNVRFVAPAEELSRDRIVVTLILRDEVWEAFSLDLPKTDVALA